MQIRNLKEYVAAIAKKAAPEKLWESEDSLLSHIAGDKTNIRQYVGLITNFATHTGSQFFYELLQNADDAESDSVFIHFSQSAMVVINNGLPFYTDISGKGRKGQLLGFLQKQKGEKFDDPDSIGKNGQGSKLLYDLLVPVHDQYEKVSIDKEYALQRAIIEENKGPIIFSWSEYASFERLLAWDGGQFYPQPCDNDQYPLLTKIFYTCYPSMPGEELMNIAGEKVCAFEHGELEVCVRYINDIKHLFNQFKFNRGTLLFIPLGDRQHINLEKIHNNELMHGISTSLAFLKNLNGVKVIDKEFQKTSFNIRSIPSIESEDGISFDISIAFPVDPRHEKYPFYNFFQFFPVTQTKFGLKYIINSKVYGIDGARQRIDLEYHRNIQALNAISLSIDEYIKKCKEEGEKEDLANLIKCLVHSNLPLLEQNPTIKDLLYDSPKRSIAENLPLVHGYADSIDSARVKKTDIDISPVDLGFEGWDWLVEDLKEYYSEIIDQLYIEAYTITDLLCKCPDRDKLNVWMSGLSEDTYLQLAEEVVESKELKPIKEIPIARFSNGKTYTLDEVIADEKLLLLTSELGPLESILQVKKLVYGGKKLFQNPKMSELINRYGKFRTKEYFRRFIDAISSLQLKNEEKWIIFKALKNIPDAESLLRDDLLLFENTGREKRPLKKLLMHASEKAPSGLLTSYELKASEFLHGEKMDEWLMQEDEIWENLIGDWEAVKPKLEADWDFIRMILEMKKIFEASSSKELMTDLSWIHSDDNEWSNCESVLFSKQLKNYSLEEYDVLVHIIHKVTELNTVPYEYVAALGTIKFAELPNIGFSQLKENWGEEVLILSEKELAIFLKLKKTGEEFFECFLISSNEQQGSYDIHLNDNKSKQYFSADSRLNEFLSGKGNYYLLPQALLSLFQDCLSLYKEDENFGLNLIEEFGAQEAFIDLVIRLGEKVKINYLNRLQRIDLCTGEIPSSYRNTFEGKVIDMICRAGWGDTYRSKVYINNRPISEFNYNDKVEFYLDKEKTGTRFGFSLAKLIKKYEGISDTLSEIREKLSGLNHKDIFSESKSFLLFDIPAQIQEIDNEEQVAFLIAFYKSEWSLGSYNAEQFKQRKFSAIDKEGLLNAFESHNINFFANFPLPDEWGLNLPAYLWPSEVILALEEEHPKDWIVKWKQTETKTDSRKKFLLDAGLNGDDSPVVKFRRSLSQKRDPGRDCIENLVTSGQNLVSNTLAWAKSNLNWPVASDSPIASAIHDLFQALFRREGTLLPHFLIFTIESTQPEVNLKDCDKNQNKYLFITKFDKESEEIFASALSQITYEVIDFTHEGYSDNFIQLIREQGVLECRLEKEICVQTGDQVMEWDDTRYIDWKKEIGKNYKVFLSSDALPVDYYLNISDNQKIRIGHFHKGDVEKKETEEGIEQIYLHRRPDDNVFKLLADHQEKLFKGNESVLVSLLAMGMSPVQVLNASGEPINTQQPVFQFSKPLLVHEHARLDKNLDLVNKFLNEVKQEILDKIASSEDGLQTLTSLINNLEDALLNKISKNMDAINKMAKHDVFGLLSELMDKASEDQLGWLVEKWEELQQDLEKAQDNPKPVALIGYIGERLVYLWIKDRISNQNGNQVDHVGGEVREYDVLLKYNGRPYYIEVKTTIKSIKDEDGMTPFFLRSRQYEFIKSNPDKNYVLSRVSLQDIGLAPIYERYKSCGNGLNEIVKDYGEEIDQHIKDFLKDQSNRTRFKQGTMIIKMNIPNDGQEFWELFEG